MIMEWTVDDSKPIEHHQDFHKDHTENPCSTGPPPAIIERKKMDSIMAKRISWKVTPKASTTVIKALSIFKRKASQARRNTLEKEANGTLKASASHKIDEGIPH